MRISDWSSDVCSSDLAARPRGLDLHARGDDLLDLVDVRIAFEDGHRERLSGVVEFDSLRLAIGLGRLARVALHQDDLVLLHHPAALPWIPRERAGEDRKSVV